MESKAAKKKTSSKAQASDEETEFVSGCGFYEMNIRVGSWDQINANTPFSQLVKDAVVLKYMQEMAVASINGKESIESNCQQEQMATLRLYIILLKTAVNSLKKM